jgi:hypothetical protein
MIEKIKSLLLPYLAERLDRYGDTYDGGYIFNPDLINRSTDVYSYGVGPDESFITFDRHMSRLGKKVFMYDASTDGAWFAGDPNFIFKKEYVNSRNILDHINNNGHQHNTDMVLKMDIEGNEFETLLNCDESVFSHFSQIGLEVHDVVNAHNEKENIINVDDENLRWENKINLFSRLNQYYYLVHIHANNNSLGIVDGIADVLELTYIRKDCMQQSPARSYLACPINGLDYRNSHDRPEITMDWWTKNS